MISQIEFEVLFYPVDKEEYRRKLKSLGAKLVSKERLFRRAVIDSRHNPQILCDIIRIRDEGDKITVSAKNHANPNGNISDKREIEVKVSSYEDMYQIFSLAGLNIAGYKENLREDWEFDGVDISIDTWPGLSTHTEIEGPSEQKIRQVAEKLGFSWDKKIITSRIEIYAQLYGKTVYEILDITENLTFEQNPFTNMPIVGKIDYEIQKSATD